MRNTVFRFSDAKGDEFRAAPSRAEIIARVRAELALPPEERTLHINGAITKGDGDVNAPWSWHFDPDGWDLVEVSIELCDANCDYVEKHLARWLDEVGSLCPWHSQVETEIT